MTSITSGANIGHTRKSEPKQAVLSRLYGEKGGKLTLLRTKIEEKFNSDAAFGIAIGFTPQKVSAMLAGKYSVKLSDAIKICNALEIDLNTLAQMLY